MQSRYVGRPIAHPQPLVDRKRISPPLATYQAKIREHAGPKRPGERDKGRRPEDGGTTGCACRTTSTGGRHHSPITPTFIEFQLRNLALDAPPATPHDCTHQGTHGGLHGLPTLLQSPLLGSTQPLGVVSLLSPNNAAPWQLLAECNCSPYPSQKAMHRYALQHPYITQNILPKPQFLLTPSLISPHNTTNSLLRPHHMGTPRTLTQPQHAK